MMIPSGSAEESIKGISHLYEHITISKAYKSKEGARVTGHTTEDYIVFFAMNFSPQEFVTLMDGMSFEPDNTEDEKNVLIREIEREQHNEEEGFFKFVWSGSNYEKSPLGTVEEAQGITPEILEDFRLKVMDMPLFFYSVNTEEPLEIVNGDAFTCECPEDFNIYQRREGEFEDVTYRIFFFNGWVEQMYLLKYVMDAKYPDLRFHVSEKKKSSAFIVQEGAEWPDADEIEDLKKKAIQAIGEDVEQIKDHFPELALNELESVYFYNKRWLPRIQAALDTETSQLLEIIEKLKS